MAWFVYRLTSPSKKSYIGITKRLVRTRFSQHVNDARKGSPLAIHAAIRKYGATSFTVETLCECYSDLEVRVCERALIAQYGTYNQSGGYNLTCGGDGTHGRFHTEETKAKIGAAHKGKVPTPELRALWSEQRTGKKRAPKSEATRKKLSAALKGRVIGDEWRAKISAAGKGRKMSPESIEKTRKGRAGWRPTAEQVEKMRLAKKGKKMKPEFAEAARKRLAAIRDAMTPAQIDARNQRLRDANKRPENREANRQRLIARNKSPDFWTAESRAKISASNKKKLADGTVAKDPITGRLMGAKIAAASVAAGA